MKRFLIISLTALLLMAGTIAVFSAETEFRIGDVDQNGKVNVKDATLIQKFAASIQNLSEEALKLADTDASGKVNVKDATLIQKVVAGLAEGFPAASVPSRTEPESTASAPAESTSQDLTEVTEGTTAKVPDQTETEPSASDPLESTSPEISEPDSTEPSTDVTEKPTQPSVDDDGYFDVIIRP